MNKRGLSLREEILISILIIIIILTLLYVFLIPYYQKINEAKAEQTIKYKINLINIGLTQQEADEVVDKYPTEDELRKAVKEAVKNKKNLPFNPNISTKLEKEYKPNIILDSLRSISKAISTFFSSTSSGIFNFGKITKQYGLKKALTYASISIFGGTPIDGYNWLIGKTSGWEGFGRFWVNLLIGLVAGFLMWLGTFIVDSIKAWSLAGIKGLKGRKMKDLLWLGFISGSLGKILITAIVYAALMQISYVNRAIEIVTFYHFTPPWLKPVVLALVIGYLPATVEALIKFREFQKAKKDLMYFKTGLEKIKGVGKP